MRRARSLSPAFPPPIHTLVAIDRACASPPPLLTTEVGLLRRFSRKPQDTNARKQIHTIHFIPPPTAPLSTRGTPFFPENRAIVRSRRRCRHTVRSCPHAFHSPILHLQSRCYLISEIGDSAI
ncbi:hypothetical protein AVEN_176354-1 [Araneus ventricosus]|uniref:Uncharacterized protein n=1 Tax=Araneus ventricosus TaxID=182803 RepID=A0A4Y2C9T2_ARAVE|nr:hypothetical protein AVEN_176354-1 [Araneus ventricosus]